jgi:hypothetical protein
MLHVLLPAAALLKNNSAAKKETKTHSTPNVSVAQATDVAMPVTRASNPIADGQSYP